MNTRLSIYSLMVSLLLLSCPLLIASNASAAWIPQATLTGGPGGAVYHQETADFSYTLSIGRINGASTVQISSIKMQLDWEASPTELVTSTVIIALPGSHTFHRTLLIPESVPDGTHEVSISITGQANGDWWNGDWWPTTNEYVDYITVGTHAPLEITTISGNPSGGAAPLDVLFTSTVSGGTPPYTYAWTFGDGKTGSQANPAHTYKTAGSYTASLMVRDAHARTAQDTFVVTVYSPLQITASPDTTSGTSPLTVHFTCSVTGGSPTYSYLWTFGDGSTSSEANPAHQYAKSGAYQVSLVVTDSQSKQKTYQTTITVSEPQGFGATSGDGVLSIPAIIIAIGGLGSVAVLSHKRRKKAGPPNGPQT